jgi:hypothetical protein
MAGRVWADPNLADSILGPSILIAEEYRREPQLTRIAEIARALGTNPRFRSFYMDGTLLPGWPWRGAIDLQEMGFLLEFGH